MMYRIRLYGDPILRKKAKPVEVFDENLDGILEEMVETMYLGDGVGLAAPQVGLPLRMFVMDTGDGPKKIINPVIIEMSEEKETAEEGCLSLPDVFEDVQRSVWIRVTYSDERGEQHEEVLEGYDARVFQHEYDHLNGILFIDRISPTRRALLKPKLLEIMRRSKNLSKG